MPPLTYEWTRYWCSREGNYSLTTEGFLQEPHKKYPDIGHVKAFARITDTPVLLLLGEPGIGKTVAITAERESIRAAVAGRGERILWPDLQAVSSPETFEKAVTNTAEFQAWLTGEAVLHLYLDALDECKMRVPTLGRLLTNALRDGPAERLWLRLTCRTAEWSDELETDLKRLLGGDRVKAFELLPLSRSDVARAVVANGIDEAAFFQYVQRTGAAALASRPVPLDFLIRCFRRGDLPSSQVDLYERGCLALCEESEHRIETGLAPALAAPQRLAVAKRIAACTIFSTRSVLLFGRDEAEIPADALRMAELAGGYEQAGQSSIEVTETALRDAVDTGLFTSRGAKVLGWAHHTYEEYLAARYLSDRALSPQQILPLIVHPDDPDRKLTPQLHGVAAWIAVLRPDVFQYVVKHEPELILLSDAVIERDEDRALLVAELLRRIREQQIARIDVMTYPKFRKLRHQDIAGQLRPVLMNTSEPEELRELAADIAEYTECSELIPELTQIALDVTQPVEVRFDAAQAVARLGDETQRAALKPLLDGPANSRQERWLIRLALKAAWPHALSSEELFEFVGGRRKQAITSVDDYMLVEHVRDTLTTDHLLPALRWVLRRVQSLPGPTIKLGDGLKRLEDAIVVKAWRSDDVAVTAALAEIVVEKIRRYEPLVSRDDLQDDGASDEQLTNDIARRRRFASFLLPALARSDKHISPWLIVHATPYVTREDVPWLIQRQRDVSHTEQGAIIEAGLLLQLADLTRLGTFRAVKRASAHNPELRTRLEAIFYWCLLILHYWFRLREACRRMFRAIKATRRSGAVKQVDRAAIRKLLQDAERQPSSLWMLFEEMSRRAGDDYANVMNLDVQSFPGWIAVDDGVRRRAIVAAERFVREADPDADSWFGTGQVAFSAIGAVRALTLLRTAAPQRFAALEPDIWRKWAAALLGIPNNDLTVPLLAIAYRHAPDEVIRRIQQLVRAKDIFVIHKLSDVLDDPLTAAILEVAQEGSLPDDTLTRLLEPLLGHARAREFAESLVRAARDDAQAWETAVAVTATLLLHASNESWPTIWPLITADAPFGRAVIERAVHHDHFEAAPAYVLDESRVADLYLWLTREYPPEQDPVHEGIFTPGTRDNISSWRSRCLDSLKRRGTRAACDALRRLAVELTEQRYLGPLVVEAESVRRQKSWQATPVAALRELLEDRSRRLVRSETELANVIIESIERLEAKLQGETPAAFDLWNTSPYRPKTENECSNYVVRHLRDDLKERGVILAREVEIRPTASPGSGERTDIHVDVAADVDGRTQTLSVIVEVKGCWNRGIPADMTEQLARRYLRDNATGTGVFLVAWFQCSVWDSSDYRKQDCSGDRAALATALMTEAAGLRSEGFDIRPAVLNCTLR